MPGQYGMHSLKALELQKEIGLRGCFVLSREVKVLSSYMDRLIDYQVALSRSSPTSQINSRRLTEELT
jgi:hypothetical protein